LRCPICLVTINGPELMLQHLTTQHNLARRRAQFLTNKLVSWRRGDLDPVLFPKVIDLARGNPAGPSPAP
jgi:hypothetical protein